jgi:hypothetical protein
MPNYDFKKDLPIAIATEEEIAEELIATYKAEILERSNHKLYDLMVKMDGRYWSIEIKEDFTCEKTGNVGLEYECSGKPSGINVTTADFYIYKIHRPSEIVYFAIATRRLKEMINKKMYFRIVNGGDAGSNSMNYLFKYEVFIQEIPNQSKIMWKGKPK